MTFQCASGQGFDRMVLTQQGEDTSPWTLDTQPHPSGQVQALFRVGTMSPNHRGTFRCHGYYSDRPQVWSPPSDPLQLLVPGTLPKPTIWAEPGLVLFRGSPVTLWCQGVPGAQEFHLYKEGATAPWDRQRPREPGDKVHFSMNMKDEHTGNYSCRYLSPPDCSEPSDSLQLLVIGYYNKPSLSALPSPVVTPGGTVTLQCASQQRFDRMVLTQQGEDTSPWTLDTQPHPGGQVQALFRVGPVTPSHRGTFRCHGYYSDRPHKWSPPSDPLQLLVLGAADPPSPIRNKPSSENVSPLEDHTAVSTVAAPQPQDHRVENVIRMGVAALVLLALGVLLWEARHSQRSTQGAATCRRDPRGTQEPS
ncbi:leukocyte immunoglobulin-like receptor subfamily A member 5 isoform X1 [Erinaceus europaeus]|uniref:Leukocyte immunoglobulin-like receptor subfamily A member 5 isoform X1 n=1 Tax=Erinaceus europaeus TaxID=9365 RepID=A0ABM3W515_ERIEU|nr:leukocyte immunoglobulin-like receptor subfamily A member 5 isoform X1 [Erinaceus europaeus]